MWVFMVVVYLQLIGEYRGILDVSIRRQFDIVDWTRLGIGHLHALPGYLSSFVACDSFCSSISLGVFRLYCNLSRACVLASRDLCRMVFISFHYSMTHSLLLYCLRTRYLAWSLVDHVRPNRDVQGSLRLGRAAHVVFTCAPSCTMQPIASSPAI